MPKSATPKEKIPVNELLKQKELDVAQAAQVLELSRATVYKLIEENALSVTRRKTASKGVFLSTASVVNYARAVQLRNLPFKSN